MNLRKKQKVRNKNIFDDNNSDNNNVLNRMKIVKLVKNSVYKVSICETTDRQYLSNVECRSKRMSEARMWRC